MLCACSRCAFDLLLSDSEAGEPELGRWCALLDDAAVDALVRARPRALLDSRRRPRVAARIARLLRDLFAAFDEAVAAAPRPTNAWRFAHAETILPLCALLGMFALDAPLTAERDDTRAFRTSRLAPMAANLVASLHPCAVGPPWRARFTLNEREVVLPGCGGDVYGDLERLRARCAVGWDCAVDAAVWHRRSADVPVRAHQPGGNPAVFRELVGRTDAGAGCFTRCARRRPLPAGARTRAPPPSGASGRLFERRFTRLGGSSALRRPPV